MTRPAQRLLKEANPKENKMAKREIIIDGSEGEGGGQVLRSSLSLSAITGKPVRIEAVRGGRKKPGLLRQHLTALRAAADICDAKIEGDELKSGEIAFHPGAIKSGDYKFTIGSAGSALLVAQTVLPILSFAGGPSTVTIEGGTHNEWSPTFDYFNQAFLPQFRKMGGRCKAEISRYGFYPAGGGQITLTVEPADNPVPLHLRTRGQRVREKADVLLANLKPGIAERELKTLIRQMSMEPSQGEIRHVDSPGPGNVVAVILDHDNVTEIFTGFGKHGVKAEAVAKGAVREAQDYLSAVDADGQAPACGEYLADQLLLPMALLGGGSLTATELSQHTRTNMDIIRAFIPVEFKTTQTGRKCSLVEVVKPD